jgi:hypothetical protein
MGRVIRSNLNTSFDICNEAISPRCDLQAKFTFGGIDGMKIIFIMPRKGCGFRLTTLK